MEIVNKYIPSTLKEALSILNEHDCYIMAGGTDLMVMKHRSSGLLPRFDKDIIFVSNLSELNFIKKENGGVRIGATTKYVDIENSLIVPQLMKDIIREIASPNIRNMATLAGNIGNASPAGDSLVGLYLLDAEIELTSISGKRCMPISEFIYGVRRIHREPNEIISSIFIPSHNFSFVRWKKVGSRRAESISKITFAGAYTIKNNIIQDFRMAFGSVSITVVRRPEIEKTIVGLSIEQLHEKIGDILGEYGKYVTPITDQRSTKDYRYKVAMNIARDFLENMK